MVYDYQCGTCGVIFELMGVRMDDRDKPQPCPECGEQATRSFISTVQGARVYYQEDFNSEMERKFGSTPGWHPPPDGGPHNMGEIERDAAARRLGIPRKELDKHMRRGTSKGPGVHRFYPGDPRVRHREV